MLLLILSILSLITPMVVVMFDHLWLFLLWFLQTAGTNVGTTEIIGALTPLIVYGVTWLINTKLLPTIHNSTLLLLVVPVLSLVVTWLSNLITNDNSMSWILQAVLGTLAVVIDNVVTQIKALKSPPPAS